MAEQDGTGLPAEGEDEVGGGELDGAADAYASLIHHGVSATLIGDFEALGEQTDANGRPRFPAKTLRELRQMLLCRTYAHACNELAWWLWTLWQGTGPDAPIKAVYGQQLTRAERVQAALRDGRLRLPSASTWLGRTVEIKAGKESFVLHLGRVPLWSALLEFVATIDPTVLSPGTAEQSPAAVANRLQRTLYGYLAEHAQPLHQQRRFKLMLDWLVARAATDPEAAIDDANILAFWLAPPPQAQDVVRFRTVAESFLCLREALQAGRRARAVGQAIEYTQLDEVLTVTPQVEDWLSPSALDLTELCHTPRFLTAKAASALEPLARFPAALIDLPLTLARWQVFGALQGRWLDAIKKRKVVDIEPFVANDYQAWCDELEQWCMELKQMADAGLAVLLAQGEVAEVLAHVLAQDANLAEEMADLPEMAEIAAGKALGAARLRLPRLNAALAAIERGLKSTSRAGFKGPADYAAPEAYVAGVAAMTTLNGRIRRLLAASSRWVGNCAADRSIVVARLNALHAGDNSNR